MNTALIAELYRRSGPHVSVYLPVVDRDGAPLARPEGQLMAELIAHGAPAELSEAAARASASAGDDAGGVAVFVRNDGEPVVVDLPEAPATTAVSYQDVPYLSPLVEWAQLSVPHAVVELSDEGTDVTVFPLLGESWSMHLAPVNGENTAAVVSQLEIMLGAVELVVLTGDSASVPGVGARLASALPSTIRVVPVESEERPAPELLADETVRLEADHAARKTKQRLDRFTFERSHSGVVEGADDTLRALREGNASLLLVHDDVADDRLALRGASPVDVGLSPGDLTGTLPDAVSVGRLVDVAIGAALNSGVEVRMIPANTADGPAAGIGATVRRSRDRISLRTTPQRRGVRSNAHQRESRSGPADHGRDGHLQPVRPARDRGDLHQPRGRQRRSLALVG